MNEDFKNAVKDNNLELAMKIAKNCLVNNNPDIEPNYLNNNAFINRQISKVESKNIAHKNVEEYYKDGWTYLKKLKKQTKIIKEKNLSDWFEQYCWGVLAKMNFNYMNDITKNNLKGESFKLPYKSSSTDTSVKQVDLLAVNDEIVILGECKTSINKTTVNHKPDIESYNAKINKIDTVLRKIFPDRKIIHIWFTHNILYSDSTKIVLKDKWNHFNYDTVSYFETLSKDLGSSAIYQLIGRLCQGQKIPALKTTFPAIKDRIGGHDCFIFSCDPQVLLKISYVVHQKDRTSDLENQAFQRLVRKSRLKAIREYIDEGGYFPNSVILNLSGPKVYSGWKPTGFYADGKPLKHDSKTANLGLLTLPKLYRKVYIIDGQHRLYGFTGETSNKNHSVPVVLFYNMKPSEQTKVFEKLNKEQKAPPPALLLIIKSDMQWDSNIDQEMLHAIKVKVLTKLNDLEDSPLYDRIVIGEGDKTDIKCLTLKTIMDQALGTKTGYYGTLKNKMIDEKGYLWRENRDKTFDCSYELLFNIFSYFKDNYDEQWALGSKDNGFLTMNIGLVCILKVTENIIQYLNLSKNINPRKLTGKKLAELTFPYLELVINGLRELPKETTSKFRKGLGTGGYKNVLGYYQLSIQKEYSDFKPDGLDEFINIFIKGKFAEEADKIVNRVEGMLFKTIDKVLSVKIGQDWFDRPGLFDKEIQKDASNKKIEENSRRASSGMELLNEPTKNYIDIIHYEKILSHKKFIKYFGTPDQVLYYYCPEDKIGEQGPGVILSWLNKFNNIRAHEVKHVGTKSGGFSSQIPTKESIEYLRKLEEWFIPNAEDLLEKTKKDIEYSFN